MNEKAKKIVKQIYTPAATLGIARYRAEDFKS